MEEYKINNISDLFDCSIDIEAKTFIIYKNIANLFSDMLFGERSGHRSWSLDDAIARVANEGRGIVLIIGNHEPLENISEQLKAFEKEDAGESAISAATKNGTRRVGIGSQILAELGAHKLRLLSTEKKFYALSGFKIEIVDFVPE